MTSRRDFLRIGGEFELEVTDLQAGSAPRHALPGFGASFECWLDTGRSALAVIARALREATPTNTVWLPAYGCDSMVEPFRAQDLPLRFYGVGESLDKVSVDPGPGETVVLIHYFGLRNDTAAALIPSWRSRGVRVVEDCVQAALTAGIGGLGEHAVTSLRKFLPQPDGALLSSAQPLRVDAAPADEAFVSQRLAAKLIRAGADAPPEAFLPLLAESEERLSAKAPRHMSWLSRCLLERIDLAAVAQRRRSNHRHLRAGIESGIVAARLSPLMRDLREGEVPLGLPVRVHGGQRDALRAFLAAKQVFCPVHWPLAHVPADGFAEEHALADACLTLPIDQRYAAGHMDRILSYLIAFAEQ